MKTFITVLLLVSCVLATEPNDSSESNEPILLTPMDIENTPLIQDLQQLGAEYVLEIGIFRDNKTPLPNGSWIINETVSVYKIVENNGTTIYNFTVLLQSITVNKLVRARYTIAYDRQSFNVLIYWFIYTDITPPGDDFAVSDQPQFIDVRELKNPESNLKDYLDEGFEYTVRHAKRKGELPKGKYRVARVFSIKDTGFSFPYGYQFLVKLANDSNRKYYRALITVWVTENIVEEDQGDFPPEYVIYPNE